MFYSARDGTYCYQILVDGKDRSAYQYVSRNFLVFSDPAWKTNPVVQNVRVVTGKTGKPLPPVDVLAANLDPGPERPWGGIHLVHLPIGRELKLEVNGRPLVLRRVASGRDCPRVDFLLDGRWNGYEVLQYRPQAFAIHTAGCHLQLLNGKVLLALPALDNITVEPSKGWNPSPSKSVPFDRLTRTAFLDKYAQLKERAVRNWGITSVLVLINIAGSLTILAMNLVLGPVFFALAFDREFRSLSLHWFGAVLSYFVLMPLYGAGLIVAARLLGIGLTTTMAGVPSGTEILAQLLGPILSVGVVFSTNRVVNGLVGGASGSGAGSIALGIAGIGASLLPGRAMVRATAGAGKAAAGAAVSAGRSVASGLSQTARSAMGRS